MSDAIINAKIDRDRQPKVIPLKTSATVVWAVPASLTEWGAATTTRVIADLRGYKEARLGANVVVASDAGAKLRVQYSLDGGSTWAYLDNNTGCNLAADAAGVAVTSWVMIGAQDNSDWDSVLLRVVGISGTATLSSSFANIWLELR